MILFFNLFKLCYIIRCFSKYVLFFHFFLYNWHKDWENFRLFYWNFNGRKNAFKKCLEPLFYTFLRFYFSTAGKMVEKVDLKASGDELTPKIGHFGHMKPFFSFSNFLYFSTGGFNGRKSGSRGLQIWLKAPKFLGQFGHLEPFSSTFLIFSLPTRSKIVKKVDLKASKWDLKPQIGQLWYLKPLTKFSELYFCYQTTQILVSFIIYANVFFPWKISNTCQLFWFFVTIAILSWLKISKSYFFKTAFFVHFLAPPPYNIAHSVKLLLNKIAVQVYSWLWQKTRVSQK